MTEQLITVGQIDPSDTLGTTLHHSAHHGNKKAVKKVLDKGIHVDYPNDEGQSPLFCACLAGKDSVVEYLLSAGASPNEKCNAGLTPVHAACYAGHVKIVMKLLNAGGDLRLHDNEGRSVKDWAILQPIPKKRMKVLEFLDKTRLFAMSSSGQDLLMRKASSKTLHKSHHRRNTVTKIIRDRIGRPSIHNNLERMATSRHSVGFGQVYANGCDDTGFLSAIPLISENNLKHDAEGETYNNGAFSVMESMWWDYTEVTVKRLHREIDPFHGGTVDILINEIEHIGKLRHPHILTLMGVCQTSNLDGLVLIYERIGQGSLYSYLHQKMERLPSTTIQDICVQICNAIIFLHLRGLVHCAITSHAISVVNPHTFKLGNFEYMIEISKCELGKKNAVTTNTTENAMYSWMAPEVMFHLPPSFFCDMYSYCVVMWEIFHGDVPFDEQCSDSIRSQYQKGNTLKIYHGKMAEFYRVILSYGLMLDPNKRKLSFLHVRDLLLAAPKDAKQYMRTHFQHLNNNENNATTKPPRRPQYTPVSNSPSPSAPSKAHTDTSRMVDQTLADKHRKLEKEKHRMQMEEKEYEARVTSGKESEKRKEFKKEKEKEEKRRNENQVRRLNREQERKRRHHSEREEIQDENYYNRTRAADERQTAESSTNRTPQKPPRSLEYITDGLKWEAFPRQIDEEYLYTVKVRRDPSPTKSANSEPIYKQQGYSCDERDTQVKRPYSPENTHGANATNTEGMTSSSTDNTTNSSSKDSTQYAVGTDLQRKTSSMGTFSFLNLGNHVRTKSAGAKPACHGQSDPVAQEYSTAGKLTTAGSLYALYNDHSTSLPLGQPIEHRTHPMFSTLPRRREPTAPVLKTDPNWFGGKDSVRDLAKVFQQQIQQHDYYQAVVDGTVNKNHSEEKLDKTELYPNIELAQYQDYGNHASNERHGHEVEGSMTSLTTVSFSDAGGEAETLTKLPASTDEETSSFTTDSNIQKISSDMTIASSTESDIVSQWVDHELKKIKRNLSREVMSRQSLNIVSSPDLFDRSDIYGPGRSDNYGPGRSDNYGPGKYFKTHQIGSGQYNTQQIQCTSGDQFTDTNIQHNTHQQYGDEFYFDDEVYTTDPSSPTSSPPEYERELEYMLPEPSPIKVTLPMKTSLKKTPIKTSLKKTATIQHEQENKQQNENQRRKMSRIPTSRSNLSSKSKSLEGAYANIVTIKSSLDDNGVHQVTHRMKNLKTGGTKTINDGTVNAKKVTTIFRAPR